MERRVCGKPPPRWSAVFWANDILLRLMQFAQADPAASWWSSLVLDIAGKELIAIYPSKNNFCHMLVWLGMKAVFMCQKGIFIASKDHQSHTSLSDHFVYREGGKLGMSGFIPHVESQLSYLKAKPLLVILSVTTSNCQPARVDNSRGKLSVCFNSKPESWWEGDFSCRKY